MKEKTENLLRSFEKYTKTDMVYIAKNGFWLTFGQGASSLVSLILAIAFAHFIPKEAYGNYKYLLSLGAIFATFSLTGIGTALVRSIAKGYGGTLRYDFWLNIKWSVIIFLGSYISAIYYFINGNSTLGAAFLIIGSFSPFLTSASLHGTYLSGRKDFRRSSFFNIYKRILPAAALIVTMILTQNVIALILVYFISNTGVTLYYYYVTLRLYKDDIAGPIDPENLNYAKHLSLVGILGGIADKIDSVLVFHFLGAASLSIYVFSMAIPDQIIGWVKNINTLALPKFAERSKEEVKKELRSKLTKFFLVLVGIYVIYFFAAPYIYKYLFPQYIESIRYSQLYAFVIILTTVTVSSIFLQAHKAVKEIYIINIVSSILRILFITILTIRYGITGAILGQLITKSIMWITITILVRRY